MEIREARDTTVLHVALTGAVVAEAVREVRAEFRQHQVLPRLAMEEMVSP